MPYLLVRQEVASKLEAPSVSTFQHVKARTCVFLEMIKIEHSLFALPFAYLGLFLAAKGFPGFRVFGWVTLAMVSFRTFAMAFNRLADQGIDARNPRTQDRALPAGKLHRSFVRGAVFFSLAIFLGSTSRLPSICLRLAWVPVILAVVYSYAKRFTWMSHGILGLVLGLAPYGAWLAAGGGFSWIPALWMAGVTAWVAGFDVLYALQDREFDSAAGLFSIPVRFGEKASVLFTWGLHTVALAAWLGAGCLAGLGNLYFTGLFFAALFLLRENWLVYSKGLQKINEAFFALNAIISAALFLAVCADLACKGAG